MCLERDGKFSGVGAEICKRDLPARCAAQPMTAGMAGQRGRWSAFVKGPRRHGDVEEEAVFGEVVVRVVEVLLYFLGALSTLLLGLLLLPGLWAGGREDGAGFVPEARCGSCGLRRARGVGHGWAFRGGRCSSTRVCEYRT